jgi:hypothetical protein
MAAANWTDGIYNEDGVTLKDGKDEWCVTCHDDVPAMSGVPPSTEVMVDNPEADFGACTWTCWTDAGSAPDGDGKACYHAKNQGCTATWTPNLPEAGDYNVYAWWPAYSNQATNAKYTVHYDGGVSDPIEVNQKEQAYGSKWNLLGNFPFAAGSSGYVVLSDAADGYVVADAVKFILGSQLTPAPNVAGNNVQSYGFFVTGHGKCGSIPCVQCLDCHDASKDHIDGEHRTYSSGSSNYQDGYRLREPMVMPRPAHSSPMAFLEDFALCVDCHNPEEVIGLNVADDDRTNFRDDRTSARNDHYYHLKKTGTLFDSDFDGGLDSCITCTACHNVHGPDNQAMIRDGKLIGNDKGINFCYLTDSGDYGSCSKTALLQNSEGSLMNPDGKSNTVNGICALSCHIRVPGYNKGSEDLIRVAELWPKVIQAKASPDTVSNEGDGSTLITASVSDPDGDFDPEDPLNDSTIVVNLKPLHESLSDSQTMYDDGLTGGDAAVDGIYSFELNPVPMGTPMGDYELTITATDHASNTGTGVFTLSVSQPGFTIVEP